MRKSLITVLAILALGAFAGTAAASTKQSSSSAGYTTVYNHGNNPGDTCNNTLYYSDGVNLYFVGYYTGFETFVTNSNGVTLQCHLKLAYGTGVSSNLQLDLGDLHQVYTPSGTALYSLHV